VYGIEYCGENATVQVGSLAAPKGEADSNIAERATRRMAQGSKNPCRAGVQAGRKMGTLTGLSPLRSLHAVIVPINATARSTPPFSGCLGISNQPTARLIEEIPPTECRKTLPSGYWSNDK